MEGTRRDIAGAVRAVGGLLPRRTLLSFSRAEPPALCWCACICCRTRLDCHYLVAATRFRPYSDNSHRGPRRLFLVLLFPRTRLVPCGNHCTKSNFRLRALPREPGLVHRTCLPGEPLSRALGKIGPLSAGDCGLLFLPGLSFRQSLRAVTRFVL